MSLYGTSTKDVMYLFLFFLFTSAQIITPYGTSCSFY